MNFKSQTFGKRLKSMLNVDFRRIFTMPLFYIIIGICLVMPILILVMTSIMDGTVTVDPNTGAETVIEGFDNTWQIIGTVSGGETSGEMDMDMMSMCNINLLYFFVAVLVGLFVCADFRSGYVKNLFTVRSKKTDYIISKTIVCTIGGAFMILAFFIGAMIGGAISGLSFEIESVTIINIVMCLLSKMLIVSVFVPIYLLMSVIAKQKAWLAILLSFGVGMFMFMVIPMVTPLNSTLMNAILCVAGGAMFSVGLGAVSNIVLKKSNLV